MCFRIEIYRAQNGNHPEDPRIVAVASDTALPAGFGGAAFRWDLAAAQAFPAGRYGARSASHRASSRIAVNWRVCRAPMRTNNNAATQMAQLSHGWFPFSSLLLPLDDRG